MLAVDTNVIVRYLTGDEPKQSAKARKLIDGEAVFVSKTVILETEWVLRSLYGFSPGEIVQSLRGFAGHPSIALEEPDIVAQALDWFEGGVDFADALHLASTQEAAAFVTFDKQLARHTSKHTAPPVQLL